MPNKNIYTMKNLKKLLKKIEFFYDPDDHLVVYDYLQYENLIKYLNYMWGIDENFFCGYLSTEEEKGFIYDESFNIVSNLILTYADAFKYNEKLNSLDEAFDKIKKFFKDKSFPYDDNAENNFFVKGSCTEKFLRYIYLLYKIANIKPYEIELGDESEDIMSAHVQFKYRIKVNGESTKIFVGMSTGNKNWQLIYCKGCNVDDLEIYADSMDGLIKDLIKALFDLAIHEILPKNKKLYDSVFNLLIS